MGGVQWGSIGVIGPFGDTVGVGSADCKNNGISLWSMQINPSFIKKNIFWTCDKEKQKYDDMILKVLQTINPMANTFMFISTVQWHRCLTQLASCVQDLFYYDGQKWGLGDHEALAESEVTILFF